MTQHQLVVCLFSNRAQADAARHDLDLLSDRFPSLKLRNIAVVHKNQFGEVSLYESKDVRHDEESDHTPIDAMENAIETGVFDATGPIGVALYGVIDGLISFAKGAAAQLVDGGFSDQTLRQIGAQLDQGKAVLLTLVLPEAAPQVEVVLSQHKGELLPHSLPATAIDRLTP